MATSITLNGVTYSIPSVGEGSWGTNVSNYLIALSTGVLSKAGGSFSLSADVDFGSSFGLKAAYYKSRGTVSTAGILRLASAESIGWRNNNNNGNLLLTTDASDILSFNGTPIVTLALGGAYSVLQMNAGATAYAWATPTGTGAPVLATSPTLVTPTLGVAAATSINKVAFTAPASGSILTIADGKTLTASNTLTFTGTDSSSVAFGTGGTVTYTANNLSVFASTTSAQLAGVISDETGTGALVFANTPTMVTPVLGVATATSINKVTITAPASSAILTIANGKTFTVSNTLTLVGTDSNSFTFPSGSSTVMTLASTDAISGAKTFAQNTLLLQDNSTNAVTISTTNSTTSYSIKLPAAQGAASTYLSNDGSGNLTWSAALSSSLNQYNVFVGNASNTGTAANTNLLGSDKASIVSSTVTMTIAAPGVVSYTSHGLSTGDKVYLTTSGALPTGLTASTTYYVVAIDANSFSLATSETNAIAGTKITTSGSQSGTHTLFAGGIQGQLASSTQRGLVSADTQTFAGAKTFALASTFSAGLTSDSGSNATLGRIVSNYSTEKSMQLFNSQQVNVTGGGGSQGFTVTGGGWGLALMTCANDATQAMIMFSSLGTNLVAQIGGSWAIASGSTHRFDYNNATNVITLTKVSAGNVTYDLTIIANSK